MVYLYDSNFKKIVIDCSQKEHNFQKECRVTVSLAVVKPP